MNVTLAFALFVPLFLGTPVYAQSLSVECLKAAQDQLKQSLGHAIDQEDKNSCAERQQAKSKACENVHARLKEP